MVRKLAFIVWPPITSISDANPANRIDDGCLFGSRGRQGRTVEPSMGHASLQADCERDRGKAQLDRMSKHEISSDSLEIVVSAAT
jgi:hypothetical protein